MKKYLLILLQLFFVFTLHAQTTKYTSANLNLRKEPSASGQILTLLSKGTEVQMEQECDCEWILVSYDGHIGYVYAKYLTNTKPTASATSSLKYYTNSNGEKVQSPTHYDSAPAGATALCRDGTYSFSRSRRGTCSHHGGVARWL